MPGEKFIVIVSPLPLEIGAHTKNVQNNENSLL